MLIRVVDSDRTVNTAWHRKVRLKPVRNTRMSKKAREAFTSKQALLIGDALLKSIDEKKLQKTKVKSLPGAKISDITNYLTNDADHYRQVVICVGTNDCDGEMNVDLLAQQYEELIQVATEKVSSTDSIIISSVPPPPPPPPPPQDGQCGQTTQS